MAPGSPLPAVAQFGPRLQARVSCLVLQISAPLPPVAPQTSSEMEILSQFSGLHSSQLPND